MMSSTGATVYENFHKWISELHRAIIKLSEVAPLIYCMSDIHGEYDRFQKMLKLIKFSDSDTLYIIGDVIDRKPGGIDILKQIMASNNMVLLLGNHEQMCLDTLGPNNVYGSRALWLQNGGSDTYRELMYMMTPTERHRIIMFLASLPDHLDIEVGGKKFHLVHGSPSDDPNIRIWDRPSPSAPPPFPDRTVIVGHTPTCYMNKDERNPFAIWHGNGIIDIDCGCGNETPLRHLGCLRLDDMEEFYT